MHVVVVLGAVLKGLKQAANRCHIVDHFSETWQVRCKSKLSLRLGSHYCKLDVGFPRIQFACQETVTGSL